MCILLLFSIFANNIIQYNYNNMEEEYVAIMDAETVNQDFDDIDLYGEKMVEDEDDDNCDIAFE